MLQAVRYPWQAVRLSGNRSGSLRTGTAHGGLISPVVASPPFRHPENGWMEPRPGPWNTFFENGRIIVPPWIVFSRGKEKEWIFFRRGNRRRIRPFRCQAPSAPV